MSDTSAYELRDAPPDATDYLRLRADSGLSPRTPAQAAGALTGSWCWVHARHRATGEAVAMGRVIGDGGWYFHVADMATLPAHQGRGLGSAVLRRLLEEVRRGAPPSPYVTLVADPPGRALYERLGFRDVAPGQTGMALTL